MSAVLLVTMVMSFAGRGCGSQNGQAGPTNGPKAIAAVGSYNVFEQQVQAQYDNALHSMGSPPRAKDAATYYGIFLSQQIDTGLTLIEAQKKSIPVTDADLRKNFTDQLEMQVMQEKIQLMQSGTLKGSSDKDFEAAFQAKNHRSVAEYRKLAADAFNDSLKDPAAKASAIATFARTEVPKVLATRLKPTDEQLKDSYKTLTVKQVLMTGADVDGQVAKVQADLKSGTSFETVIDRYSKDTPLRGKKLSSTEAPLLSDQLLEENYAPLRTLKEGDISPVIKTPAGSVIYKIVKIKTDLPKDFDKNKDTLKTQLATKLAQAEFRKDIAELGKTTPITWKDAGWHALYDYYQLVGDVNMKPDDKKVKLKSIIDAAKKADHSQPASLAYYAAAEDLKVALGGKPDAEMEATLIEAIQSASEYASGPDLDLELADIYASKKDGANLTQALVKASQDNTDYSAAGQATFMAIQAKVASSATLIPTEGKKAIADAQANWTQNHDEQQKEEADAAKQAAAEKKQADIEKKKFEAEQKAAKKADDAKKPADSGSKAPDSGKK